MGDQVLAIYHALGSCCGVGLLIALTATDFGMIFVPKLRQRVHDSFPTIDLRSSSTLTVGLAIGVVAMMLALLSIWFVVATWRSRRWAIWLTLILNLPGAVLIVTTAGEQRLGAIIPVIVTIYCILRVSGSVGPKL